MAEVEAGPIIIITVMIIKKYNENDHHHHNRVLFCLFGFFQIFHSNLINLLLLHVSHTYTE